jgi:hypothetical protein
VLGLYSQLSGALNWIPYSSPTFGSLQARSNPNIAPSLFQSVKARVFPSHGEITLSAAEWYSSVRLADATKMTGNIEDRVKLAIFIDTNIPPMERKKAYEGYVHKYAPEFPNIDLSKAEKKTVAELQRYFGKNILRKVETMHDHWELTRLQEGLMMDTHLTYEEKKTIWKMFTGRKSLNWQ